MVKTVDNLIVQMKNIMHQWHMGTRPGNDGEAGNTLEDLLEVPENNFQLPDFGDVEIKTKKIEGGSLLTLLHKEPQPPASVPKLLRSLGWRHAEAGNKYSEEEMSFRSTTYGHRYSVRGLSIEIEGNQLQFIYEPSEVYRAEPDATGIYESYGDWSDDVERRASPNYRELFPIFYDLTDIAQVLRDKLNHTLLVYRKTKTQGGRKYYWYEEAYLMRDIKTDSIEELVKDGSLVIDFDARTGHNHGTKIRIKKSEIGRLFNESFALE